MKRNFPSSRPLAKTIFTLAASAAVGFAPLAARAEQPRAASEFDNSVGIVTHFYYTGTPYYDRFDELDRLLVDSGIKHIRDGVFSGNRTYLQRLAKLAQQGIRGLIQVNEDIPLATVVAFPAAAPGITEMFEGPNELDLRKRGNFVDTTRSYQAQLYRTIKGNPQTSSFKVVGPSITTKEASEAVGDLQASLDYGNMHNYFGGRNPGIAEAGDPSKFNIEFHKRFASAINGAKPVVTTETGYCESRSARRLTTPAWVNGRYEPRMFLEQFNHGVIRTYQYELVDEGGDNPFSLCGILQHDLTPKPAYRAIKSVLGILADGSAPAAAHDFAYALTGQTSDVHHTLLEKADGSIYLALWIEKPCFDADRQTPIDVPDQRVSVKTGSVTSSTFYTLDDNGEAHARPGVVTNGSASLVLTDRVGILKLTR